MAPKSVEAVDICACESFFLLYKVGAAAAAVMTDLRTHNRLVLRDAQICKKQ